ncbi:MAG TPA: c-type cytochrome [Burkholderiales bacterium]|nr:c-type cytochrome [Burkholderiales bacterium]
MKRLPLYACAALAAQAVFSQAGAADAERGRQLYESRCIGCHSIDANRVGPAHKGVFGRKAGAIKDYDYSDALKKSRVVWGEKTLGLWLTNPERLIPGQKMGFSVPEAKDRADLIEFLKLQSR